MQFYWPQFFLPFFDKYISFFTLHINDNILHNIKLSKICTTMFTPKYKWLKSERYPLAPHAGLFSILWKLFLFFPSYNGITGSLSITTSFIQILFGMLLYMPITPLAFIFYLVVIDKLNQKIIFKNLLCYKSKKKYSLKGMYPHMAWMITKNGRICPRNVRWNAWEDGRIQKKSLTSSFTFSCYNVTRAFDGPNSSLEHKIFEYGYFRGNSKWVPL